MSLKVNAPTQYTPLGKTIKKFLNTGIGKKIGFILNIRGFNRIGFQVIRNGKVVQSGFTYNSRVDKGAALSSSLLAGENLGGITDPAAPKYIALSTSTLTPAKDDTTLSDETSASGLARAVGTIQNYTAPSALDSACSYDVYKEFTNTSEGTVTIKSAALFDAGSNGNLFVEANLSSNAVLEDQDVLKIIWSVNL